ncbi:RNA 2',3'-cyclic phosphodiesterase [Patescibacteria group bacterium]|nr:RNA 2',3'-cyclic phosphodiesterase [Patescibacteria group bacterium]
MKKRLFIAINFDSATRLAIARLMSQLPNQPGLNKVKVDNLHLTLLFLGDTEEELIPQISQQLDEVCKDFSSLSLKFGRLGGFPDLKHPQVIWIGLEGNHLSQLHQVIAERLSPLVPTADTKPFRPHLTVARSNSHLHPESTVKFLLQLSQQPVNLPPVAVSQIDLMESALAAGGSIYKRISTHPFRRPGLSARP